MMAAPDTTIAVMIAEPSVLGTANSVALLVVLILGAISLVTVSVVLIGMRRSMESTNRGIAEFLQGVKPLLTSATHVVADAQEVVAMLRTDVERVSEATQIVTDQLVEMADTATDRIDEVNAVLDVLQNAIEDRAIGTVAAARGLSAGTRAMRSVLRPEPREESA